MVSKNIPEVVVGIAQEVGNGTVESEDSEATLDDLATQQVRVGAQLAQQMADDAISKAIYAGKDNIISKDEDFLVELIRVTSWQKKAHVKS